MDDPIRPRRAFLLAASAVFVVAHFVPFGTLALYPLTLFTTWVHEMGHGLAALAVGGHFDSLKIFGDTSGYALVSSGTGWRSACTSAAGLLAPPIVGALILSFVHGPRRARITLGVLAAAMVGSAVLWVRSVVGVAALALDVGLCALAAWKLGPVRRVVAVQAIAVVLALDTLTRMTRYAFMRSVVVDGQPGRSDIQGIAEALGGPFWIWGVVVVAVALALLTLGLWRVWRARPASPRPVSA